MAKKKEKKYWWQFSSEAASDWRRDLGEIKKHMPLFTHS